MMLLTVPVDAKQRKYWLSNLMALAFSVSLACTQCGSANPKCHLVFIYQPLNELLQRDGLLPPTLIHEGDSIA